MQAQRAEALAQPPREHVEQLPRGHPRLRARLWRVQVLQGGVQGRVLDPRVPAPRAQDPGDLALREQADEVVEGQPALGLPRAERAPLGREERREHLLHEVLEVRPQVPAPRLAPTPIQRAGHPHVDQRRHARDQGLHRGGLPSEGAPHQLQVLRVPRATCALLCPTHVRSAAHRAPGRRAGAGRSAAPGGYGFGPALASQARRG